MQHKTTSIQLRKHPKTRDRGFSNSQPLPVALSCIVHVGRMFNTVRKLPVTLSFLSLLLHAIDKLHTLTTTTTTQWSYPSVPFHSIALQFSSISLCHCDMECTARWRSVKLLLHHSDRGGKNAVQMALNPLCTCTLERGEGERGIKKVVLWCKPNSRYAIFSD